MNLSKLYYFKIKDVHFKQIIKFGKFLTVKFQKYEFIQII